jgi:hypothetical protein
VRKGRERNDNRWEGRMKETRQRYIREKGNKKINDHLYHQ